MITGRIAAGSGAGRESGGQGVRFDQTHMQPKGDAQVGWSEHFLRRAFGHHAMLQADDMGGVMCDRGEIMADHELGKMLFLPQAV